MIETTSIPVQSIKKNSKLDGEGSVQFQMDPTVKIGNAKVFADNTGFYGVPTT